MSSLVSDPAELLRPISMAVKVITRPILENARDHSHYQHLLAQKLAPIFRGLEEPLRLMRSSSPYLNEAATDELRTIANELEGLAKSMAAPIWWNRLVRWRLTDCRPAVKQFSADLSEAASVATWAQPQFAGWKEAKHHLDKTNRYWVRVEELQSLERELATKLDAARASRKVADEFFHEWLRGKGFVRKPKRIKEDAS